MTRRLDQLTYGDPVKLLEDRPAPQHGDRPPREPVMSEELLAPLREWAREHPTPIIMPPRTECAWWPPLLGVVRLSPPPGMDGRISLVVLKRRAQTCAELPRGTFFNFAGALVTGPDDAPEKP